MSGPLLIGPLLRYVDEVSTVIWVEVAAPATVTVHAGDTTYSARSFTVHGHHYALVDVEGLSPGASLPYSVDVGDVRVWPALDGSPDSRVRTLDPAHGLDLAYGSCRTSAPHDADGTKAYGVDALRAVALRMREQPDAEWPDLVMFLGDQVYADETSPRMKDFIASRRDIGEPPGEELKDYEEYAHVYALCWNDPAIRWLLSALPSTMIFDDHDIRDDWNTSSTWRQQMAATSWWHDRIVGGLASYWVYQHLGNLSPAERAADTWWQQVQALGPDADAGQLLDDLAERADEHPDSYRWSYSRDVGRTRIVVVDSRSARVLTPDRRSMLDDDEMSWFDDRLTGDVDHLLIGTSLPYLLPPGLHHLEAWDEAVAEGAWGEVGKAVGERIRQGLDLEHWAAFQQGFRQVAGALRAVVTGQRGPAPETVVFLSGDVHHSYLAEVDLGPWQGRGRLLQAVCSPIRNPMPVPVRWGMSLAARSGAWRVGRWLARSAKVDDPPMRWRLVEGPWFENNLASIEIDGRSMRLHWETAVDDGDTDANGDVVPRIHTVRDVRVP
ncbi:MAG: alkaline phosphatase D family protein [Nocardioidaceae bacterium]